MKKIEAIVDPFRFHDVKRALSNLGVASMTVTEVKGLAREQTQVQNYRGRDYEIDLLPKLKLEVFLPAAQVAEAVAAINQSTPARKGAAGGVFVYAIDDATLVRSD
jgi:nitrogen regulatory protein P-II 1